jgi:myosin-5
VLVSVNPFRSIAGMYGPEVVHKYVSAEFGQLAPHIYQVAANAYRSLVRSRRSQAILVSGESGAGKTEAAKAILQCLALTSSKGGGGGGAMGEIERGILESNPLLEAFGNAQTVCNSNSSRFGKFIKVQFDGNGRISGAVIDTYLLEKSRLVWQASGERCYHVFYQFLAALSVDSARAELAGQCYVEGMLPEHFHYLNQSACYTISGVDDRLQFSELERAMSVAGLSGDDIGAVFQTIGAILHLGNLGFEPKPAAERKNEDDAVLMISDPNQCDVVAYLLGVDSSRLSAALLTRQFRGASRGSVYAIPLEMPEATEGRDALAKALYSKLFDWLVARVNQHLSRSTGATARAGAQQTTIGVLDIFGFEIFEHNSFEQLLINFANERLQAEFNKTMFKMEQEEYTREGIDWQQIEFSDNQVCVDVIDKKPFGVLKLLDEECHMPKGSDLKLLDKYRRSVTQLQCIVLLVAAKRAPLNSAWCLVPRGLDSHT